MKVFLRKFENVCIEVFKYKGKSQIHIRHTDVLCLPKQIARFNTFNVLQSRARVVAITDCLEVVTEKKQKA